MRCTDLVFALACVLTVSIGVLRSLQELDIALAIEDAMDGHTGEHCLVKNRPDLERKAKSMDLLPGEGSLYVKGNDAVLYHKLHGGGEQQPGELKMIDLKCIVASSPTS